MHTMEYYLATKKNEILPFATAWMDLEGIMLSEIRQTKREKYGMIFLYVESKEQNKRTNKIKTEL